MYYNTFSFLNVQQLEITLKSLYLYCLLVTISNKPVRGLNFWTTNEHNSSCFMNNMPKNNVGDSLDGGEVEYHEELHEGFDDVEL